jgi:hypothetical protein
MKKLFSFQIMKQSFKSVWFWWLISIVVISLNLFLFPSATGIDETNILNSFALEGLLGNGIIFLTICTVLFANIFITSEIDRGTLAITLNTPTTRLKILLSKAVVFILLLISISLFVGISGTVSAMMYDINMDLTKWWTIMALWALYSFAVGGITFAVACWFNKSRYTIGISSAILASFFILRMIADMEKFKFCKYFTLQTLFDMTAVIDGKSVVWQMIALPLIAIPFYLIGIIIFTKKNLPL